MPTSRRSTSSAIVHVDTPAPVADQPHVLEQGDQVADALLVDQGGKPRPWSSFRGHRVALTFVYTRCPLPDYCPLMERNFAAVQQLVKANPKLADVQLLTVTMDPEFDTPAILKPHALDLGADPDGLDLRDRRAGRSEEVRGAVRHSLRDRPDEQVADHSQPAHGGDRCRPGAS